MSAYAQMPGQMPPQLAALLAQAGPDTDEQGAGQLQVLQEIMQDLPRLIATLTDPQDTQDAIGCLQVLAKIQTRLMGSRGAAQPPR